MGDRPDEIVPDDCGRPGNFRIEKWLIVESKVLQHVDRIWKDISVYDEKIRKLRALI